MIKLSFRKNLIYLLLCIISYLLRRTLSIVISENFGLDNSLIFCFLMFLGEIVGGLVIYRKQISFLNKTKKKEQNNLAYKYGKKKAELKRADKWPKITILIYFASFFDLIEFIILYNFIPKIADLSATSTLRLCCIITITSSIFCYYTLRFKIGKHQIFSLVIIAICLSIITTFEFIYKPKDIYLGNYILSYLFIICYYIFLSFTDVTERYLYDYNFLNPLFILMTEGISGFITTLLYSIYQNPFKEIEIIKKDIGISKFIILIILLVLYSFISSFVNIYKILCNILYSPMTKSLGAFFLNSGFIIYHFIQKNDFLIDGKSNFFYFIINLVFSILIDFLALIYSEFVILNFCGLADDTHIGIAHRANKVEEIEMVCNKIEEGDYIYSINTYNEDENDINTNNSKQ